MPFKKIDIKKEIELLKIDKDFEKAFNAVDKEYEIIEQAIKLRKQLNISQQEISLSSGLTQQMVSRIEKVGNSPGLRTFIKYLDAAGLEINICTKNKKELQKMK